ncbi:MAG: TetR/AcrR family transcriptional regulator [Deferrisomatales bacterium]
MKRRTIDPQDKVERVVEAARRLFVEKGYHRVSIPAIVAASGVSIGAIYHHFGNKENLARRIHEATLEEFTRRLAERVAGCRSVREQLRAYAELVFEIAEEEPVTMEYMLLMRHGEFLRDVPPVCEARPFQWVQEVLADAMERGEVRRGDPLVAAAAFTGVVLRMVRLRLENVAPAPLQGVLDEVFAHAWASVAFRG